MSEVTKRSRTKLDTLKRWVAPVAAGTPALSLAACESDAPVRSLRSQTPISIILRRSLHFEPVLVDECPPSEAGLSDDTIVVADMFGDTEATAILMGIGGESPRWIKEYSSAQDPREIIAFCGAMLDTVAPDGKLTSSSQAARYVIPAWPGCEIKEETAVSANIVVGSCANAPVILNP